MAQIALDRLYKSIEDHASSYPYEDDSDLFDQFRADEDQEPKTITQTEIDAAKAEFFDRGGVIKKHGE